MLVQQTPRPLEERYSKDVVEFCQEYGLTTKDLDLAVALMHQTFPDAERISVEMENDPESDHRWVMVDALVSGAAAEIDSRHENCSNQLMKLLPWPKCIQIRTLYTLA